MTSASSRGHDNDVGALGLDVGVWDKIYKAPGVDMDQFQHPPRMVACGKRYGPGEFRVWHQTFHYHPRHAYHADCPCCRAFDHFDDVHNGDFYYVHTCAICTRWYSFCKRWSDRKHAWKLMVTRLMRSDNETSINAAQSRPLLIKLLVTRLLANDNETSIHAEKRSRRWRRLTARSALADSQTKRPLRSANDNETLTKLLVTRLLSEAMPMRNTDAEGTAAPVPVPAVAAEAAPAAATDAVQSEVERKEELDRTLVAEYAEAQLRRARMAAATTADAFPKLPFQ